VNSAKHSSSYPICVVCLFLGMCLLCSFWPQAWAIADTPSQNSSGDLLQDAPGKDMVVKKCTQCHDASQFATQRKSGDDWQQVITQMSSNGLTLTDEEEAIVLDYLTKNLGPTSAPPKINVNKATAGELQKVLDITPAQADAIVKARTGHEPFKDWHGVAAIDGVDAKKIEADKDRMMF
jgi:DNA uptake protein ComE-like DNA-binding protein